MNSWGMTHKNKGMDFKALVEAIRQVDERLAAQAGKAINISLTLRNWMIGSSSKPRAGKTWTSR
jgi:hypothetical protein